MFFVVVLGVSWRLNDHPKAWKLFMLAASYAFYAAWDWHFLGLIILSSVVNAAVAISIHGASERSRKPWLIAGLVFNLGLLGYFKYSGFFVSALVSLLSPFGLAPTGLIASVALPIAISFFTFQGISYIVDVYRRETEPYALAEVALYLSFFPHLVAGPIVRAQDFIPQLRRRRNPAAVDVSRAVRLIGRGLVKKVIVATTVANFVDPVFAAPGKFHALAVLVGVWGYAVQLYCDFSGYTDMAIGIALLLGFKFPQNFDRPYAAVSIQEFWRRWHITLSDWLRDYLYIPLGGNKNGHTNRNLIITMALGGLWHGASWSFIVWGLFHGFGLAGERMFAAGRASGRPVLAGMGQRVASRRLVRQRVAVGALEPDGAATGGSSGLEDAVTLDDHRRRGRDTDETIAIQHEAIDAYLASNSVRAQGRPERVAGMDPGVSGGRVSSRRRGGQAAGSQSESSGGIGGTRRSAVPGGAGGGRDSGVGDGGGAVRRWMRRHTDEIEFDEEWERLRRSLETPAPRVGMHPFVRGFLVFQFVCVGWGFFRAPDVSSAFGVLGRIAVGWTGGEMAIPMMTLALIVTALAAQFVPRFVGDFVEYRFSRMAPIVQALGFGVFLAAVQMFGPQGVAPFIYFQF